jgi:glycine reductase complex component B subunit gamma
MTPVAVMIGANRVVQAAGIIHPLGNADLSPDEEKSLRRRIVKQALKALEADVAKPTVFSGPSADPSGPAADAGSR